MAAALNCLPLKLPQNRIVKIIWFDSVIRNMLQIGIPKKIDQITNDTKSYTTVKIKPKT